MNLKKADLKSEFAKIFVQSITGGLEIFGQEIFGQRWKYSDSVGNIRTTIRPPIVQIFPTPQYRDS